MPAQVRIFTGTEWLGVNAASVRPPLVDANFTVGETRPQWFGTGNISNNVGVIPGRSRTTVQAASLDMDTPGQLFQDLDITDAVNVRGQNHTFRNCRFTYSYSGNAGGGIAYIMQTAASGIRFERCEFQPDTPGDRWDGVYGHDFTLHRCAMINNVDSVGANNKFGADANVVVEGCWLGHNAWFNDDRPSVGDGHNNGTHNDGLQHFSGNNVTLRGNFFQGAKLNALNPGNVTVDEDGLGFSIGTGNGVTPLLLQAPNTQNNRWPQQAQMYVATGVSGAVAPPNNITVDRNWFWNFDHGVKLESRGDALSATITNNRFGGRFRDWSGTYRGYPIRYDAGCTVNGATHPQGTFLDDAGNVWDSSARAASSQGDRDTYGNGTVFPGTPIVHRIDKA